MNKKQIAAEVTWKVVGRLNGLTLHGQAAYYTREVLAAKSSEDAANALIHLLQILDMASDRGGDAGLLTYLYAYMCALPFHKEAETLIPALRKFLEMKPTDKGSAKKKAAAKRAKR